MSDKPVSTGAISSNVQSLEVRLSLTILPIDRRTHAFQEVELCDLRS